MKACVVVFPGSNCDRDIKVALEAVVGCPVSMVWHEETAVPPAHTPKPLARDRATAWPRAPRPR